MIEKKGTRDGYLEGKRASWNFAFLNASKPWNVCQGIRDEARRDSLNFVEALSWSREGKKNFKNKKIKKKRIKRRERERKRGTGDEKLE